MGAVGSLGHVPTVKSWHGLSLPGLAHQPEKILLPSCCLYFFGEAEKVEQENGGTGEQWKSRELIDGPLKADCSEIFSCGLLLTCFTAPLRVFIPSALF